MAVEIPVIVDIESAFADAAKRAKTAIKPLQDVIESAPASLFIDVKVGKSKKVLVELFDNAMTSVSQYQDALNSVNAQIDKLASKGGFNLRGSGQLTAQEKNLLEAAGLLETKLRGVGEASSAMGRIIALNMKNAELEVQKYMSELDKLQRKQNLSAKPSAAKGLTKPYQEQIDAANLKIQDTRRFLAFCSVELDNITKSGVRASASMGGMKTAAQEMAAAWKRGEGYLARYNAGLATSNFRLGTLVKSAASLAALHAATGFIRNVREVTSEFEMQRVALGGIIQDTERAEDLFKRIKAAAIQSPFEIKDLVSFTKQLSAYRIETESLFDVTMKLADVSAGLGVDMSRLVLAYGQVRAASVLRGQELRQFTEAGIPLVELLANKFRELGREGTTTADVFELISERAVPFKMIEDIFNDMTSAGGIFYKMQEKQSETLKGQWMKLKDALSIMYDEIGNTSVVHGAMETLLKDAMELFQNWRQVSKSIGVVVASMAAYKVAIVNARIAKNALTVAEAAEISALRLNVVARSSLISAIFGETAATKVQLAFSNLYVAAKRKEYAATNLFSKALWKMTTAMLSNPYAIALAGVVALVAGIVKLTKKTKEASVSSEDLQKTIASYDKAKSHAKDIEDLCRVYDELSTKANKTTAEEEKLSRVTKELAKSYPGAITGANEQTKAIELNTAAIRDQNEAVREAIRLSLLQDKESAEKGLEQLQSEYDRISEILSRGTVKKGAYGGEWFEPITAEERAQFGARLLELENEMAPFKKSLDEANKSLEYFKEGLIGPPLPDFFGDAWRGKLNSYSIMLDRATSATKAFQKTEIEQFKNAQEAAKETASRYEKQTALVEFYSKALMTATGAEKTQFQSKMDEAKAIQGMYASILSYFNAWNLVSSKKTSGADSRLSNLQKKISEITNAYKKYLELRKYMSEQKALTEIDILFPQLKGFKPTLDNTIARIQGLLKGYKGPKDKVYLDMQNAIDTEVSNLNFDNLKRKIDDSLKRVSEEIKRSETARNFYNNILDLTGDEDLSTTLSVDVYGGIGEDFKERIQRQLVGALKSLDPESLEGLNDSIRSAFETGDYEYLVNNISEVPEKLRDVVRQVASDSEKYNAGIIESLIKTFQRAKTYGEKQVDIAKKSAQRITEINALSVPQSVKDNLLRQNAKKEAEETARAQYEAFKESPMYIELFENLEGSSTRMLRNMRENLLSLKEQWKNLSPRELRELQTKLDDIEKQLATRNPFKSLIDSINEYRSLTKNMSRGEADLQASNLTQYANSQKELLEVAKQNYEATKSRKDATEDEISAAKLELETQSVITDEAIEQAEAAQETANSYRIALKHIQDAANGMKEWTSYINESLSGIGEIVSTFASDETAETFNIISDGIEKTFGGLSQTAGSAARLMAGDFTAIPSLIKGIGESISGIFGTAQQLKINAINKKIEEQDDILTELEYSYGRLEKAIGRAFGTDYIYNYNKQMESLLAKQKAYEEQARLERDKGKKADQNKIEDYTRSARDAEDQIADLSTQLSEFFSGTDLTSAARDFAESWIEAYKQFGSTTDAMKERFNDMIENMVVNSLAAQLIQGILKPVFDQIDTAAKDGELTAQDMAAISTMVPERIQMINDSMGTLMNQLLNAGINLRDQAGTFTGISRDIAGASEESITGLAAGINTQNFYMQHIDMNVALILSYLTGGTTTANASVTGEVVDPYKDQMLLYASHLPTLDENLASLLTEVRKVIRPRGSRPEWVLHTNV